MALFDGSKPSFEKVAINPTDLDARITEGVASGKLQYVVNPDDVGHTYSIGLTDICVDDPHELLILGPIDGTEGAIFEDVVEQYPHGQYPTKPLHILRCMMRVDDKTVNLRVLIVKIDDRKSIADTVLGSLIRWQSALPDTVYQIVMPDRNNILPGEPGYDKRCVTADLGQPS